MIKKIFKWLGFILLAAFILLNIYVLISGKFFFYKAVRYNFADIDDYKIFSNRIITRSKSPTGLPVSKSYNKDKLSDELHLNLVKFNTVAFLVLRDDSLLFEKYWENYNDSSYSNSFSVAKSVVSILIGVALKEGRIQSLNDKVRNYLENYDTEGREKITIKNLLVMSSGLNWDEAYASPFSMTTEAYYGSDINALMGRLQLADEPGKYFKYQSGNTQLLAMILQKVYNKQLSDIVKEKLWEPLGMEHDALWSLDKENGQEKAYCCLNSNARDFARIGLLYLNKGNFNGRQIVDTGYAEQSVKPAELVDKDKQPIDFYGYHWWIMPEYGAFYARGINGQYIIVIPERKLVIVRLGDKRGDKTGRERLSDALLYTKEVIRIFGKN